MEVELLLPQLVGHSPHDFDLIICQVMLLRSEMKWNAYF